MVSGATDGAAVLTGEREPIEGAPAPVVRPGASAEGWATLAGVDFGLWSDWLVTNGGESDDDGAFAAWSRTPFTPGVPNGPPLVPETKVGSVSSAGWEDSDTGPSPLSERFPDVVAVPFDSSVDPSRSVDV